MKNLGKKKTIKKYQKRFVSNCHKRNVHPPTHKHPLDVSRGNLSMDAAPNTVRENLQSRDPSIEVYVP